MMVKKIKILILIKPFGKKYPKQREKFILFQKVKKYAKVRYWHKDGEMSEILNKMKFRPDLIFHYDIAWNYRYAPKITGLDKLNIPTACFVIDTHFSPQIRREYIDRNKFDLIFSATKHPFLNTFPQYKHKFRWLPFSINPHVFKDWKQEKKTRYLLLGQFYCEGLKHPPKRLPPQGRYPFREKVFQKFWQKKKKGFLYFPHPGHYTRSKKALIHKKYARELNKTAIFFTCGGKYGYPVLKFFEALACKTLLLAEPNQDITELGFRDGIHYIACTQGNFYQKAMYYYQQEKLRKRIARNGFKFVHKEHTHHIRAKEFVAYIQEFLSSKK